MMNAGPTSCHFCGMSKLAVPRLIVQGMAAICSYCLGDALAALREDIGPKAAAAAPDVYAEPAPIMPSPPIMPVVAMTMGYTGRFCDICGGCRMTRSGTCEKCEDCGTTSGCS